MKSLIHRICLKITNLFPNIFVKQKDFVFLDGHSKHLEKKLLPPCDYTEWNGSAISKHVGQGRLYILPSHLIIDDDSLKHQVNLTLTLSTPNALFAYLN